MSLAANAEFPSLFQNWMWATVLQINSDKTLNVIVETPWVNRCWTDAAISCFFAGTFQTIAKTKSGVKETQLYYCHVLSRRQRPNMKRHQFSLSHNQPQKKTFLYRIDVLIIPQIYQNNIKTKTHKVRKKQKTQGYGLLSFTLLILNIIKLPVLHFQIKMIKKDKYH